MGWLTPFETNISDVEYQATEKGRAAAVANGDDWADPTPGRARADEEMKGPAMASDVDKAIQENLKFTLELADKILLSAGKDPNAAFIKAIGTLAQVIYHSRRPTGANPERHDAFVENVFGVVGRGCRP